MAALNKSTVLTGAASLRTDCDSIEAALQTYAANGAAAAAMASSPLTIVQRIREQIALLEYQMRNTSITGNDFA